ncbi:hypothetical protein [Streptomyces lydicus]|uniref:hypothetical protein n=1 Tax=Streptomyces lydicus TaxID=47763 RepID=UPI00379B3786
MPDPSPPGANSRQLTSLEPAVGALVGLLLLGQHLAASQWAGVRAVAVGAVGAVRTSGAGSEAIGEERSEA